MDSSRSHNPLNDADKKVLATLLETFGGGCSQQEIASAYCRAGRDLHKSSELLCELLDSRSSTASDSWNSEMSSAPSEKPQHEDPANGTAPLCSNKGEKPKNLSASLGTVAGVLGKTYTRPASSKKESCESTKPLKLKMEELTVNELDTQPVLADLVPPKGQLMDKDTEDFIFTLLGDGCKLSRDVIREVLGHCGYNAKKGVEELLALSAKTLGKGKAIDYDQEKEHTGDNADSESFHSEEDFQKFKSNKRNTAESASISEERSNLSRELLMSLFNAPDRSEDKPKIRHLQWGLNRTRVIGQKVVTKPPEDIDLSLPSAKIVPLNLDDDDDDDYHVLRRAVKQHWDTMKAYYEAAVDAFSNGDRERANYCMEQGKYYNRMAREADEKSSGEILEPRKSDTQDEIPLDLHSHSAKEAVSTLKISLRTLAKIPSFKYLKVIVNTDFEDATKGKRKRLVLKLLEREHIRWTKDDGNPGTILIPLDEIDKDKLSFGKDPE